MEQQQENKSRFRFDEWETVDCNDCKRYLDETCDGTLQGSQRLCKAFLATRRVDLPLQVKSCQKGLESLRDEVLTLRLAVAIEAIVMVTYMIAKAFV
jgi:hypothetical protein